MARSKTWLRRSALEPDTPQARSALLLSLLLSIAILCTGLVCTWRIGKIANRLDHELYHAQEGVESLQKVVHHQKEEIQ